MSPPPASDPNPLDREDCRSIDFAMDLPYDQAFLMENVIDVAHIHGGGRAGSSTGRSAPSSSKTWPSSSGSTPRSVERASPPKTCGYR
ncbi:MAG: hypothetical protein AAF628_27040 [Planctomycetota bacterium]